MYSSSAADERRNEFKLKEVICRYLQVGSRRVIQTAGVIMLMVGMFGKVQAFFTTIPSPIIGGVFMTMFGT